MINRSTKFVLLLQCFVRFLIFPILAGYGLHLKNSTPEMLGFIIAVFGIAAAIMTIPMATIAKKINVRASLTLGFLVFAAGSFLAASAETIQMLALARAIQGAGAVSPVLMLLTHVETVQPKKLGSYIKINLVAFVLAMSLAVIFFYLLGGPNVFRFIGATATLSLIFVLLGWVNDDLGSFEVNQITRVLANKPLYFSYLSSLLSHAIFAGFFVVMPINILMISGIPSVLQPVPYIISVILAVLLFLIDLVLFKKCNMRKSLWVCSALFVSVSMVVFNQLMDGFLFVIVGLTLLFTAMILSEVVSAKYLATHCAQEQLGAASLVNMIARFIGVFIGAGMAGLMFANLGDHGVYIDLIVLSIIWLVIMLKSPRKAIIQE